jgi:thiamine-monophosphate kinase
VADRRRASEFEIIARYFRPLAEGRAGALGLADDAALIEVSAGRTLVATTDTMVAGVDFFENDAPDLIARKLLRVNLSDLAAMGAEPVTYLLAVALPENFDETWLAGFCRGLEADQKQFGLYLSGGDTSATPGPATLTIAAFGEIPKGKALLRSGAKDGDAILVSGTIGDGALGLLCRRGTLVPAETKHRDFLISRYHVPEPRVALGAALRGIAHAAIDISDGLIADLGHICETSNLGAVVEWARVPLSAAARESVMAQPGLRDIVLGGGDDYELLFTAAGDDLSAAAAGGKACDVPVTAIGRMRMSRGVTVVDSSGREIAVASPGYRHF